VWAYRQLAERGSALTGYPAHSVYEDFTWDSTETMSGAADDWAYEHLGVYAWTTEFWDIVHAATGTKQSTHFWYTGPTTAEALAVLRWLDGEPSDHHTVGYVDWYPFDHPQLGPVELGGWNDLYTWTNPSPHLLRAEVAPHAEFAVFQALASPCLEIKHTAVEALGDATFRITVGIANTGWLPTHVTARAMKNDRVRPIVAELVGNPEADDIRFIGAPPRQTIGQLDGGSAARFNRGHDGTPDRAIVSWVVRCPSGTDLTVTAKHDRAGQDSRTIRAE